MGVAVLIVIISVETFCLTKNFDNETIFVCEKILADILNFIKTFVGVKQFCIHSSLSNIVSLLWFQ